MTYRYLSVGLVMLSGCGTAQDLDGTRPLDAYETAVADITLGFWEERFGTVPSECERQRAGLWIADLSDGAYEHHCPETSLACYLPYLRTILIRSSVIDKGAAPSNTNLWWTEGHLVSHEYLHFLSGCSVTSGNGDHSNPAVWMFAGSDGSVEERSLTLMLETGVLVRGGW